jgi:hypothetical protein
MTLLSNLSVRIFVLQSKTSLRHLRDKRCGFWIITCLLTKGAPPSARAS